MHNSNNVEEKLRVIAACAASVTIADEVVGAIDFGLVVWLPLLQVMVAKRLSGWQKRLRTCGSSPMIKER